MNDQVKAALEELSKAVDQLNGAVDQRVEQYASVDEIEAEVARMKLDRAKLAETLDESEARVGRLNDANSEVSARLVSAMETVRSVLEHDQR